MVGFYDENNSVVHIHPLGEEPASDEARAGPELRFHIEPQQAGFIKLYAQVRINGDLVTAAFGLPVD